MKKIAIAGFGILAFTVTVWAEGKNLQHFPKDISTKDLKAEMKVMKASLGVDCAHCHQQKPSRDFSVDTDAKKIARSMLDMQKKMNEACFTSDFLGMRKTPKATCYMCHKGHEKPEYEPKNADDEKKFKDAVDAGKKKRTVDAMKKLTDEINKTYFTWKDAPKATCWMCHRGRFEFKTKVPDVADDAKGDEDDAKKDDAKKDDGKKEGGSKDGSKKEDD